MAQPLHEHASPHAVDIVFVGDDTSSNSLGRAYCLWLLSQSCELTSITVAPTADTIWGPLLGTRFADSIITDVYTPEEFPQRFSPRLVVCVKALPENFAYASSLSLASGAPLVFDLDEPDIEAGLSTGHLWKKLAKSVLRPKRTAAFRALRHAVPTNTATVSNPYLKNMYGGTVIPHVRTDLGVGSRTSGHSPRIVFVGTNRPHKGLSVLRAAIAEVHQAGYSLTITDSPPLDAKPWESWVGQTSLGDGMRLVADADVIVIPSRDTLFSRGQLPAKLIDAMLLGRAIIASDLPATSWALGDTGQLVTPGDYAALVNALLVAQDPSVRRMMGSLARRRALDLFTVEANADRFRDAMLSSMSQP